MAKRRDITEKLSFDVNPCLVINGEEIEVNADAPTVLKVMGLFGSGEPGMKDILDIYNLIFSEASRKKIDLLRPSFKDLLTIVEEAVDLVTGEEDASGEQ